MKLKSFVTHQSRETKCHKSNLWWAKETAVYNGPQVLKQVLKWLHVLKRCKSSSYSYRQLCVGNDFKVTKVKGIAYSLLWLSKCWWLHVEFWVLLFIFVVQALDNLGHRRRCRHCFVSGHRWLVRRVTGPKVMEYSSTPTAWVGWLSSATCTVYFVSFVAAEHISG